MELDWQPCAQFSSGWQDAKVPDTACSNFLRSIGFDPTPKQYDFITCPADDVGFGGARGGAKSQGVVGDWLWHDHQYGEAANGAVFRRERTQLTEFINEASKIFERVNSTITEPKARKWKWHALDKYFESPNGSRLKFVYLDNDADADKHQSGNFTRLYIEERGTFPRERPLNMVLGTLRSGSGVPCQQKSTFNPGGVGHGHCKERYRLYEQFPRGYEIFKTAEGDTRCFIPSRLRDNPYLGESYIRTLRAACAGNESLLNAWLDGDWSVVEGSFFHEWRNQHVIAPFDIPPDWLRFRSFAWGSAKPSSVGWWAVAPKDFRCESASGGERGDVPIRRSENSDGDNGLGSESDSADRGGNFVPKGAIIRYREWYAQKSTGSAEGLKLTAEQIADGIKQRDGDDKIVYSVASPQIFLTKGGPSIAERMARRGVGFLPGDDARVSGYGHLGGWDQVRARLVGRDGVPAIFCFTNCADSVRTLPALQHDRDEPEEIDDESEAAAAHDWRFACMSRPWSPAVEKPVKPKLITIGGETTVTMDDLWKAKETQRSTRF